MKKKTDKKLVLDTCLAKQEALLESFKERVALTKADLNSQQQSPSQTEDRTAGKMEMLANFEKELAFAQAGMEQLKSLNPETVNEKAEPGALVVTRKMTFFIAISSEKIKLDNTTIYPISTKAPIYAAMQGLEKGNTFTFNNTPYTITDIY